MIEVYLSLPLFPVTGTSCSHIVLVVNIYIVSPTIHASSCTDFRTTYGQTRSSVLTTCSLTFSGRHSQIVATTIRARSAFAWRDYAGMLLLLFQSSISCNNSVVISYLTGHPTNLLGDWAHFFNDIPLQGVTVDLLNTSRSCCSRV
jgi:hypothetical protein